MLRDGTNLVELRHLFLQAGPRHPSPSRARAALLQLPPSHRASRRPAGVKSSPLPVPRRRCTSRSPTSPQSLQPTSTPALGPPRHHRSARATHALLPTSVLQLPQTAVPARARRPAGPTKPPDPATASPDLATGPPDLSAEGEAAATQKLQERAAMERRALQTPVGKPCCHCVHGRTDSRRPAQAAAKRAEEGSWGLAALPGVAARAAPGPKRRHGEEQLFVHQRIQPVSCHATRGHYFR